MMITSKTSSLAMAAVGGFLLTFMGYLCGPYVFVYAFIILFGYWDGELWRVIWIELATELIVVSLGVGCLTASIILSKALLEEVQSSVLFTSYAGAGIGVVVGWATLHWAVLSLFARNLDATLAVPSGLVGAAITYGIGVVVSRYLSKKW